MYFGSHSYQIKSLKQKQVNNLKLLSFRVIPKIHQQTLKYISIMGDLLNDLNVIPKKQNAFVEHGTNCIVIFVHKNSTVLKNHLDYDQTFHYDNRYRKHVTSINTSGKRTLTFFNEINIDVEAYTMVTITNPCLHVHKVKSTIGSVAIFARYLWKNNKKNWNTKEWMNESSVVSKRNVQERTQYKRLLKMISELRVNDEWRYLDDMELADDFIALKKANKCYSINNKTIKPSKFNKHPRRSIRLLSKKYK